ncbi:hypothetical protein RHMOL_Rhmol12G0009400 [Rhododendron molle]|nr:hypothetical protein RHMOL_Rhmol12G0009400 [Rhododendron molle]
MQLFGLQFVQDLNFIVFLFFQSLQSFPFKKQTSVLGNLQFKRPTMQQGAKGTHASLDEFKYGFPTNGLAVVLFQWWGSSSSESNGDLSRKKGGKDFQEDTKKTEELVDDGEKPASGKDESNKGK